MQKEINAVLGERVKEYRKVRGYTREVFAEKISVSTRFLADVESGKVGVSISTLKNISLELNVSADFLIGITSPDESNLTRDTIISKINSLNDEYLENVNMILDGIVNLTKIKKEEKPV